LDELGLVKAVRAFVDQQVLVDLKISVADSVEYPNMPAAVEVTAYRIALEGVTNIIRHAQASNTVIRIFPENGSLIVEIMDNGIGIPEPIPVGIGLTSMRERAEELGGKLVLAPQETGTCMRACLPLARE
jgi:signal transduction histidine kinase